MIGGLRAGGLAASVSVSLVLLAGCFGSSDPVPIPTVTSTETVTSTVLPDPAPTVTVTTTVTMSPSVASLGQAMADSVALPVTMGSWAETDPATGKPVVYLTVDDGPSPTWTPVLIQLLEANQATATFFMLGQNAAAHPELTNQVLSHPGFSVGNHTWGHVDLTRFSDIDVRDAILGSDAVLGGVRRCVRPPYGATNSRVRDIESSLGRVEVLWTIDTEDWRRPGTNVLVDRILAAKPGNIVLIHDAGGDRRQTIDALSIALPKLVEKGYVVRGIPGC